MPSRRPRRSAALAAGCLAVLIGVAAVGLTAGVPDASAQGTQLNPWDCGSAPFHVSQGDGRGEAEAPLGETLLYGVTYDEGRAYCEAELRRCAEEQSDPALEIYCTRVWCAYHDDAGAASTGAPVEALMGGRTPRHVGDCGLLSSFISSSEGTDPDAGNYGYNTQLCPADVAQIPRLTTVLASFCIFVQMRCETAMRHQSDSHQAYCDEIRTSELGLPAATDTGGGGGDREGGISAGSRLCDRPDLELSEEVVANCEATGTAFRRYPLTRYAVDFFGQASDGGVIERFIDLGASAISEFFLVRWAWSVLVWIVNGILLLLEWAFTLDFLGGSLGGVEDALLVVHYDVLGEPWTLAAIALAGLWGIWNGLVRMKTIETLGALGLTLLMMIAALIVIHDPGGTVWKWGSLANDAAMGILGGAASADPSNPEGSLTDQSETIFELLVQEPWCALQFGNIDYCAEEYSDTFIEAYIEEREMGDEAAARWRNRELATIGETWLHYDVLDEHRETLHKLTADGYDFDDDDNDELDLEANPGAVRLMGANGILARLGLMAVIAVGLLGALLLLIWLTLKLVMAAIMVLLLTLVAPVMLLAPAFGDAGRAAFITWAKRLVGAVLAKLIYALFLGVVLLVVSMILALELGWFPQWLILLLFWWGVFLKRSDIVGFLDSGESSAFPRLASLYYGYRFGRDALSAAARPARWARGAVGRERLARAEGTDAAIGDRAQDRLRARGRGALEQRRDGARQVVNQDSARRDAEARQQQADTALGRATDRRDDLETELNATPTGQRRQQLNALLGEANARRTRLEAQAQQAAADVAAAGPPVNRDALQRASAVVNRYGDGTDPISDRDADEWVDQRRSVLLAQDPAADNDVDRRDRELLRWYDQDGGLGGRERRDARDDPGLGVERHRIRHRRGERRREQGTVRRSKRAVRP